MNATSDRLSPNVGQRIFGFFRVVTVLFVEVHMLYVPTLDVNHVPIVDVIFPTCR